jgi:hypothetical protein
MGGFPGGYSDSNGHQVREAAHELAEAETVIILAHLTPHAVHSLIEDRSPFAELGGGNIAVA